MATTIVENEKPGVIGASAGTPFKLSWGAILGGTVVALGVLILLYSLGLALGLSSVDPSNPDSARSAGIGTGIWGLIAPLIALFIGGFLAARTAGVVDKAGGAMHGAVMWGLTTIAGVVLMGMVVSTVVGTAFKATTGVVGATGAAVAGAASQGGNAAQAFGLDANDALGPVNERLKAEGKPTITANQLEAATKDIVTTAVRTGNVDRELLVTSIAENTRLSRQDSEDVANRVQIQIDGAKAKVGQVGEQVQQGALQAADKTGRAFWGVFGALLLGLVASVLGAGLGVSKRQRVHAEGAISPTPRTTTTRREVYP
ncbi:MULTISPECIES: hypothetical protein [Myxococcus]|uniref:PhnA-like protein n=1 Tax=Myxococcus llanfairpwllgwyngyllgogerychwyrndrobwllllantysiliogogogochensis TaxID=2590453 RepID=A0A540WJ63_9BACT|nr:MULTISPECIES: hypothetical protein [Myxococcus]NTX05086.1 hypothetical protein [Myxococcus sp. CA040A]NTX15440.1 hypothetical protein [Myxococcus sp. CA056]NTX39647.1 hypothetical protein [Myxococcus sp. CA033]TQF09059.1 hypothetical protein FJV41_46620 [Myxococcus llanfairpwllgwyngyllgogerychwyrndrobwllllantysiliogogogochensis]